MATLGSLVVSLEANVAKFQSDMGKAAQVAETNARKVQEAWDRAASVIKVASGGIVAGLALDQIGESIVKAIDAADAMNDMSKKTGIAVEQLVSWQLIAKQSGTDMDTLAGAIAKGSKYMVAHSDNLKSLGINAKTAEELIIQLSGKIAALPADDPRRAALAMEVLGKNAATLLPLLSEGEVKLRKMVETSKDYSVLTSKGAQAADTFNDELDILKQRMSNGATVIAQEMLPALTKFMQIVNGTRPANALADDLFSELLDAQTKLNKLKADKADGGVLGFFTTDADIARQEKYIATVKARLSSAVKDANKAVSDAAAAELDPKKVKGLQGNIDDLLNKDKDPTAKDRELARVQAFYREVDRLGESATKLNQTDKTQVDLMQEKLDGMSRLDPAIKGYIQGQLDLARATDEVIKKQAVENSFYDAMSAGDSNAAAMADAEQTAAEERVKTFEQMSIQLQRENEDLNIGLITNDKQRAKAQIDIEHTRELERLRSLDVEGANVQELLDQENANYELRVKQLDTQKSLAKDLGMTFTSAFEDAMVSGKKFGDVLQSLGQDIEKMLLRRMITQPLANAVGSWADSLDIGGMLKGLFNANGNAFDSRGVVAFANGGVVGSPTPFSFGGGQLGVMGEAGPEAIVPLTRGSDGKLGIRSGGGGIVVQNNIQIVESPGTSARVEQTQNATGGTDFKVIIEQVTNMMSKDIQRGSGLAPVFEKRYGLNRVAGGF